MGLGQVSPLVIALPAAVEDKRHQSTTDNEGKEDVSAIQPCTLMWALVRFHALTMNITANARMPRSAMTAMAMGRCRRTELLLGS